MSAIQWLHFGFILLRKWIQIPQNSFVIWSVLRRVAEIWELEGKCSESLQRLFGGQQLCAGSPAACGSSHKTAASLFPLLFDCNPYSRVLDLQERSPRNSIPHWMKIVVQSHRALFGFEAQEQSLNFVLFLLCLFSFLSFSVATWKEVKLDLFERSGGE